MRKYIVIILMVFGFQVSFAQDLSSLKKAVLIDEWTVEMAMNSTAGPNGYVSWYTPPGQPLNTNFRLLGAKVSNGGGTADYVFMVDTVSKTAANYTITFNGKTIHYDRLGLPDDMETFQEVLEWAMKGALGL